MENNWIEVIGFVDEFQFAIDYENGMAKIVIGKYMEDRYWRVGIRSDLNFLFKFSKRFTYKEGAMQYVENKLYGFATNLHLTLKGE